MNLKTHVYLNGKRLKEGKESYSVFNRALLFGEGIFETFLIEDNKLFFVPEHLERLKKSAEIFDWAHLVDLVKMEIELYSILKENIFQRARLRLVMIPRATESCLIFEDISQIDRLVYLCELPPYELGAVSLMPVFESYRSRLNFHKTINYAESARYLKKARQSGDQEILYVLNGKILEAATANVFFIKGNNCLTPSLKLPILSGVTRSKVINFLKMQKFNVIEKVIQWKEMNTFEGVFLTNTTKGILPVRKIDGHRFGRHLTKVKKLAREFQHWLKSDE